MHGQIREIIEGAEESEEYQAIVNAVFQPNFRTMAGWRAFLKQNLPADSVTGTLATNGAGWTAATFQGLYVACWIHHPLEKGTYMIPLATQAHRDNVSTAVGRLPERISSHLSGRGRTACQNWAFLEGYEELLVQYEVTSGVRTLFLKAEGHTLTGGIGSKIMHGLSWVKKISTGSGATASAALHNLAQTDKNVEARAAENYAKHYKSLLKTLGFRGSQVTVRDFMVRLFDRLHESGKSVMIDNRRLSADELRRKTNRELGTYLSKICQLNNCRDLLRAVGKRKNKDDTIRALQRIATTMQTDGDAVIPRVHREIRATPAQIDASLAFFQNPLPGYLMAMDDDIFG